MAQIPSGYLRSLTDAISKLSQDAQAVALPKLNEMVASGNYAEPYDLVEDLIEYLEPILSALTGNSAALTANAYDLLRMAAIDAPMGAEPYPAHDPEVTKKALYGMAGQHRSSFNGFIDAVMRRIDYEAKLASGTTMTSNGARDSRKPKFARVPQGPTTCPFCLMLASRGFVYYSEKSGGKLGDLNRFHENCDCRVVPQWGGESYEGYDPDEYDRQYRQLMDEGKLDAEQLARASEKAKQRRREESRAAAQSRDRAEREQVADALREGKAVSFRAATPDGGKASYHVNTPALRNLRDSVAKGLGYEASDPDLAREIMARSAGHRFEDEGNGFYSQNVRMKGADGEMSRVKLVWAVRGDWAALVDIDYLKKGAKR